MAASISAASTNENGPNVDTMSSTEPTAAMRCSGPSVRHAGRSPRANSESLATREPCIRLMPVGDLFLTFFPTQIHLAIFAQRWEVDQTAVEVADDHFHRVQLRGSRLE